MVRVGQTVRVDKIVRVVKFSAKTVIKQQVKEFFKFSRLN